MFLSDSIDLSKAESYILTIRIKPDGFSFLIQSTEDTDCFDFQETGFSHKSSLPENIQRIIFDYNFLTDNFKKTNIIIVSPEYELVPVSYYNEKDTRELYNFTHQEKSDCVLTSALSQPEIRVLFGIEKEICLFLNRSLYNPVYYHHADLLTDYFSRVAIQHKDNKMFVNLHDYFTDIMCFNGFSQILHSHTYSKENNMDLVYYILNSWDKCKFKQTQDNLFIYTQDKEEELINILKEYIKNIHIIHPEDRSRENKENDLHLPLDISLLME